MLEAPANKTYDCVLVMPAYNEADCIVSVVTTWIRELEKVLGVGNFQMLVVNDGSKDATGMLLDQLAQSELALKVVHQANAGHGAALLHAYRLATQMPARYVFHVDSDDQFQASDFQKFWALRQSSSFILGWRQVRHDALHRLIITQILKSVLFVVYGSAIADANVPYRLILNSYLKKLLAELPTEVFAPNIFLSVMAKRDGQKIHSIPVAHEDRKTGVVSIVRWKLIKVCLRSLRELVQFRLSLGSTLKRLKTLEPVT